MFTIELVVSRTVLHTVSTQIFEFHAFCCDVLLKISLSTYWISLWCWLLSWLQLSAPDVTFTGSIRIKNTGSYKQSTLLNPSELSHKTLVSSDFSATFALTWIQRKTSNMMLRSTPIFPFLSTLAFQQFSCGWAWPSDTHSAFHTGSKQTRNDLK